MGWHLVWAVVVAMASNSLCTATIQWSPEKVDSVKTTCYIQFCLNSVPQVIMLFVCQTEKHTMFQLEGGSLFTTSWLICNPAVKVTVLWKGLADVASSELRLAEVVLTNIGCSSLLEQLVIVVF